MVEYVCVAKLSCSSFEGAIMRKPKPAVSDAVVGAVGCDATATAMHGLLVHAERLGVDLMRFDDLIEVVRRRWIEEAVKRFGIPARELEREGTAILAAKYQEEFRMELTRVVRAEPYWKKKGRARKVAAALMLAGTIAAFVAGTIAFIYVTVVEYRMISEELIRRTLSPAFPGF